MASIQLEKLKAVIAKAVEIPGVAIVIQPVLDAIEAKLTGMVGETEF